LIEELCFLLAKAGKDYIDLKLEEVVYLPNPYPPFILTLACDPSLNSRAPPEEKLIAPADTHGLKQLGGRGSSLGELAIGYAGVKKDSRFPHTGSYEGGFD
jgi:hypothetical protein